MPDIVSITDGSHEGEEGFIIEWQMIGFTKGGAKFRARGMTALRFPTALTGTEVVGVKEFGDRDFNIDVFVPTEGFPSAGITNPVEWISDQFDESKVRIS